MTAAEQHCREGQSETSRDWEYEKVTREKINRERGWGVSCGAAGDRGGHEREGEHAAVLDTFQGRKPLFPRGNLWLCNKGNSV